MQFKEGANVFTSAGEKVGTIDRIIIEPDTKEVTHLVVQKGFLFTEDKIIPMTLVGTVTPDRVTLRQETGDLDRFPDFEESHYLFADGGIPTPGQPRRHIYPLYYYPPIGGWRRGGPGAYAVPMFVKRTKKNIPEGTVAIDEGTEVLSSDGEHVGDVERVFTDPKDDRATHLLISKGLFFKENKLIPSRWIKGITEKKVRLVVDSGLLEQLPEYQG